MKVYQPVFLFTPYKLYPPSEFEGKPISISNFDILQLRFAMIANLLGRDCT
jgi:hypothetical protein